MCYSHINKTLGSKLFWKSLGGLMGWWGVYSRPTKERRLTCHGAPLTHISAAVRCHFFCASVSQEMQLVYCSVTKTVLYTVESCGEEVWGSLTLSLRDTEYCQQSRDPTRPPCGGFFPNARSSVFVQTIQSSVIVAVSQKHQT